MSSAQLLGTAIPTPAASDSTAVTDEFATFFRSHPKAAPDLLYILEVYKKCDHVQQRRQSLAFPPQTEPSFEEAYVHVFGSPTQLACERCKPAFYREKRILSAASSR